IFSQFRRVLELCRTITGEEPRSLTIIAAFIKRRGSSASQLPGLAWVQVCILTSSDRKSRNFAGSLRTSIIRRAWEGAMFLVSAGSRPDPVALSLDWKWAAVGISVGFLVFVYFVISLLAHNWNPLKLAYGTDGPLS